MTLVTRRYTFKLYPTKAQEAVLNEQARLCAHLWNAALEQREIQWAHECQRKPKGERKGIWRTDQAKEIKNIRKQDSRYRAMSQASLELTLENLDLAFRNFYKRATEGAGSSSGHPGYKDVNNAGNIPHRDHPRGWFIKGAGIKKQIYAKGIPGLIRTRGKFPAEVFDIRTLDFFRRGDVWWASIVVKMESRMLAGSNQVEININLIDEFASVKNRANGECLSGPQGRNAGRGDRNDMPPSFLSNEGSIDQIQSIRDRRFKKFSNRWRREKKRIARLKAKEARQRREALHLWTTRLIREASDVLVISPDIVKTTKSAKGDERNPGAAVATVAALNRHILSQAPAAAIQMLEYKAQEAGIQFTRITPAEHATTIGHEISQATKTARKASRIIRKEAA